MNVANAPQIIEGQYPTHTPPVREFNDDDLLDEFETSIEFFGGSVSHRTLQDWRFNKTGPRFVKLGPGKRSPVRYRVSDLRAYVERQTVDPEAR